MEGQHAILSRTPGNSLCLVNENENNRLPLLRDMCGQRFYNKKIKQLLTPAEA